MPNDGTLKDYFAAQALNGLIANLKFSDISNDPELRGNLCRVAYALADEMVKARPAPVVGAR